MQSIAKKVKKRIYSKGRGFVFTKSHFLDIGTAKTVAKALERLADQDFVRRLARGLYDYPKIHPDLGEMPANYEYVAKALAGRDCLKIQSSGAYSANLLGLNEQVPAKIVFLTDGPNRTVLINKQQIVLKRTTPKNMATTGRISGLVIQALRYIGKNHIDNKTIKILSKRLSQKDKRQLLRDIQYAPAWIGKIFRQLHKQNNYE